MRINAYFVDVFSLPEKQKERIVRDERNREGSSSGKVVTRVGETPWENETESPIYARYFYHWAIVPGSILTSLCLSPNVSPDCPGAIIIIPQAIVSQIIKFLPFVGTSYRRRKGDSVVFALLGPACTRASLPIRAKTIWRPYSVRRRNKSE